MPNPLSDTNNSKIITDLNNKTIDVIENLDMGIDNVAHDILAPFYNKFPFFANSIFGIPLGNLIVAFSILALFLLFRRFFTTIIMSFLQKLTKYTETYYDDRIVSALKGPVSFAFILVGLHLFFAIIFKETPFIKNVLNSLIIFDIFWMIIAIANALRGMFYHATSRFNPDLSKEMGDFILKLIKILIGGIGFASILQVWGINVTALIASLGLGGLAFALAAKDTASNLFGSFALLADKSIRIGEWVKVGNVEGVVESIGMRTTKLRSFEESLLTIPNQMIANTPIENFSRRGIRRIKLNVGLTYGTNKEQIVHIVEEIKEMLQAHESISKKDTLLVTFKSFGDSSLNIMVYAFANSANWEKYLDIREDIHVKIMGIVEKNGSSFAFPSRSIYIENPSSVPSITEER